MRIRNPEIRLFHIFDITYRVSAYLFALAGEDCGGGVEELVVVCPLSLDQHKLPTYRIRFMEL